MDENNNQFPQQPVAPQQGYVAPQQPYAEPQQPVAPQQDYAAPQQGYYAAPQQGFVSSQQPYAAPQQPYAAPQQPYTAPQQPYAAPQQPYAAPQQAVAPQQPYAAPQQPYVAPQQPVAPDFTSQSAPQPPVVAPVESAPKKNNKMLIIIIAIVAVIAIVVGGICLKVFVLDKKGNNSGSTNYVNEYNNNVDSDNAEDADNAEDSANDADDTDNNSSASNSDFLSIKRQVKKISNIESLYSATHVGIIYYENGLYGIMNYSGKKVTKPIYYDCDVEGNYFAVATNKISEEINDVAKLNFTGLIDGEGNTIIPAEYFVIDAIDDRYVEAIEVTDITDSKEESIAYITSSFISLGGPKDGDTLLKGNWCIIDTTTGQKVPGAGGTLPTNISIDGIVITFVNDEGERENILTDGSAVDPDAEYFDNGYYAKDDAVYDASGNIAFNFDSSNVNIARYLNGYFIVQLFDGGSKYCLYDIKGNKVSVEFDEGINVEGNLIYTNSGKVCTFDGAQVIDTLVSGIDCDKYVGKLYVASGKQNFSEKTVFLEDGTVIWSGNTDDNYYCYLDSKIEFYSKSSSGDDYYSFKENKFNITGDSEDFFTVSVDGNSGQDLIDVISGETLLDSYSGYDVINVDGHFYIKASKDSFGFDIYEMTIK